MFSNICMHYTTVLNSIQSYALIDQIFYRATCLLPFNIETKLLVLCVKPSFNTMEHVRYTQVRPSIDNQKVFQMLPR